MLPKLVPSVQGCISSLEDLNLGRHTLRYILSQQRTLGRCNEVYVGNYNTFRATVAAVYDSAVLLSDVFGASGVNSTPPLGSTLLETADGGSTTTSATATTGVYRYGTEDIPPLPLDNQRKIGLYDEIIAAKRITDSFARTVIRRYNWDVSVNPIYDMYKPDYSATPAGGGQIGKPAASGATSISDAKFYVMNSNYEVFKCLYNGEDLTVGGHCSGRTSNFRC